jgi:insertion element IS1 protein InsB
MECEKNGHIHNGKQNHHCHDCGRQFVQCCEQYLISNDKRGLIERLLVERISLRGICRAVGVTLKWLLGFLVQCVEALPDHLHVQPVSCHGNVLIQRLEVEADEMASFVQEKANTCPEGGCQGFFTGFQTPSQDCGSGRNPGG